ncbi:MAG TPA: NAD(P)/FAD-dependent oxidoreductase [Baekduia sp.]|uniref:flavin monoamine oxidase family protein n=1 Tax=Baekduia sp. TaxID=2600305 RepID=UPI002D790105|nr:NAD(P)/FAD-dependent oxidoreductase [Baekduia sp.]HET6509117.1 NAD(P)/FAD-dependent oxidoreductase [Baekduia sp.]
MYDTIVIGAGFAGLTAARDLAEAGRSVLVLEARDRIAGRTHYAKLDPLDQKVEYGGTWIVPRYQPHVAREIDRYGLELTNSPTPESYAWVFGGERKVGGLPFPDEEIPDCERAVALAIADARRIEFGTPFEEQGLEDLDVPYEEWLDRHEIHGSTRELFASYGGALCFGVAPKDVSALHVLSWVAGLGNSAWNLFTAPSAKFAKGTGALAAAMAESLDVRLSTPVTAIAQHGDAVEVTTAGGETVAARTAVVAVPLNVWKDISFTPALSAGKTAFTQEELAGKAVKVWVQARTTPRFFAGLGWNTPLQWLSTEFERDEGAVMVGFGISQGDVDAGDRASVEAAVKAYVPDAEVLDWWSEDWNGDPYSQGTWTAFRPGQISRLAAAGRASEGRLAFATADVAIGFSGWIEGAIESGATAAATTQAMLTAAGAAV